MAVKRHGRWTPSLHPRGKNGEFSGKGGGSKVEKKAAKAARKADRKPVSSDARAKRRKTNALHTARAAVGVGVGISTIASGRANGSRSQQAIGAARIGLAVAERHSNVRDVKFRTSKGYKKLSGDEKKAVRIQHAKRKAAYMATSVSADVGLVVANPLTKALRGTVNNERIYNRLAKDMQWNKVKSENRSHDPFTRYQGPGAHRTKKAPKRGKNSGVYNVSSIRTARELRKNYTVLRGR